MDQELTSVIVRLWRAEDGPAAAEMIRFILNDQVGIPTTRADLADVEHNAYGDGLWVAEEQGRIIGTIALMIYGGRHGALRRMFTTSNRRGPLFGTAQVLMDTLIESARTRGLTDIVLGTTSLFERALRFYAKNGYVQIPFHALPSGFPVMPPDDIFCCLDLTS